MKALRIFAALSVTLFAAFFPALIVDSAQASCVNTAQAAAIAAAAVPTPAGDPATVTTLNTCGGDDDSYRIPITTTITFDNQQYTQVYATTNSVITFGRPDGTYWTYPNTPSISLYSMDWLALPNYLEGSEENLLSVVDVSGSMDGVNVSGSVTALDVAISLGMYVSERATGVFKDQFITFSTSPEMLKLTGTLQQRYDQMSRSNWSMSTDISAVFKLILNAAVKHNVDEKDMPTKLVIFSDMQFNECVQVDTDSQYSGNRMDGHGTPVSVSAMDFIEQEFKAAGYKCPGIVFWNLNAKAGNVPVTYDKSGAALVSGFSPAICSSILGGEEMTPISIMLKSVMVKRYDF